MVWPRPETRSCWVTCTFNKAFENVLLCMDSTLHILSEWHFKGQVGSRTALTVVISQCCDFTKSRMISLKTYSKDFGSTVLNESLLCVMNSHAVSVLDSLCNLSWIGIQRLVEWVFKIVWKDLRKWLFLELSRKTLIQCHKYCFPRYKIR